MAKTIPKLTGIFDFATFFERHFEWYDLFRVSFRDLACRNILLGPYGNFVKTADFGLSYLLHHQSQSLK